MEENQQPQNRKISFTRGREVYSYDNSVKYYDDRMVSVGCIQRILHGIYRGVVLDDIVILDMIRRHSRADVGIPEALDYVIRYLTHKDDLFSTKSMQQVPKRVSVGSLRFDHAKLWVLEIAVERLRRILHSWIMNTKM